MKKLLCIFGTRPEAIKMAPLIKKFKEYPGVFDVKVCVTAQHRTMLDQVLDFFEITPDFDLDLMRENQNLFQLTANVINGLQPVMESYQPNYVFVHGDTTTSTAAALAAFYAGAKVCHIEAGLRTYNKNAPYPEEVNRQLTARLADFHFAPTQSSAQNLINEAIPASNVYVTGNTVIDALFDADKKVELFEDAQINTIKQVLDTHKKLVLVTGHRRENFGQGFVNICNALKQIALNNPQVQIIYPVHLNPNVYDTVHEYLDGISNINLVEPLSYPAFVWLMKRAYLILTDSGGIQEEAPSFGIPVLVMRNTTERPEALEAGTVKLVGTDYEKIVSVTEHLLHNENAYKAMSNTINPYGDGKACQRIADVLLQL